MVNCHMASITFRVDVLPKSQQLLWTELGQIPERFVLYGGTAVALHLGHRQSVDFDFFGFESFAPGVLYQAIPFLSGAEILQQGPSTLTCLIDRNGPIKVSFFGVPKISRVARPHISADIGLRIASKIDLAGTKAAVVQQRSESKDYIDLDALMTSGIDLASALSAASFIYGKSFNPQITLKALSYFGDGDLMSVPEDMRHRLTTAVTRVDLANLPQLAVEPP